MYYTYYTQKNSPAAHCIIHFYTGLLYHTARGASWPCIILVQLWSIPCTTPLPSLTSNSSTIKPSSNLQWHSPNYLSSVICFLSSLSSSGTLREDTKVLLCSNAGAGSASVAFACTMPIFTAFGGHPSFYLPTSMRGSSSTISVTYWSTYWSTVFCWLTDADIIISLSLRGRISCVSDNQRPVLTSADYSCTCRACRISLQYPRWTSTRYKRYYCRFKRY